LSLSQMLDGFYSGGVSHFILPVVTVDCLSMAQQ
jgi:hypothetical protein